MANFYVNVWTPCIHHNEENRHGPFRSRYQRSLDLSFRWPRLRILGFVRAVSTICRELDLNDIQTLTVELPDDALTSQDWLVSFKHLEKVQTLYVCGQIAQHAVEALALPIPARIPSEEPSDASETLFLPSLDVLWLRRVDFQAAVQENGAPFLDELLAMLKERTKRGKSLQHLKIDHCAFDEITLALFEQVVTNVEWDGRALEDNICLCET